MGAGDNGWRAEAGIGEQRIGDRGEQGNVEQGARNGGQDLNSQLPILDAATQACEDMINGRGST